jgi:hypothetical protein
VIDLKQLSEKASDSMCRKTESVSNETDQNDLHPEKLDQRIISTQREIVKDLIRAFSNAKRPICATGRVSPNAGKKTCGGTWTVGVR